MKSMRLLKN